MHKSRKSFFSLTGGLAGPSPFAWALSPPLPSEQSIRLGGIKDREILSALILSDWNICRDWCFFSSSLPPAQKSQTNNGRSQKTSHPLARRRRELHHRIAHVQGSSGIQLVPGTCPQNCRRRSDSFQGRKQRLQPQTLC